jgi:hypothetical protein
MDIIYTLDVLSAAPSGGVPLQDLGIVTNVPKWNDAPTNTILTTNYNITNLGVKHEEVQISEMLNFAITSGHIKLYGNGIEIPDNNASLVFSGNASQYIRGDGSLGNFPTTFGTGGGGVSYYLNGGIASDVATYYEMSKIAVLAPNVDFPKVGDGLITQFITSSGEPNILSIPGGNWSCGVYASMNAMGGTPAIYLELLKYDGSNFTSIATSSNEVITGGTNLDLYPLTIPVPQTSLLTSDRLVIRIYAINAAGKTTTIHTQDSHLCEISTTFSTGVSAINTLTSPTQYFTTGTSGSNFGISSTGETHTFNLPVASATNTGKLSSTDWSTFNNKGNGSVTQVSVVAANGLAGTVATDTTTPAITLTTSVTGVLKGNGTAISAASAGTDYVTPNAAITGSTNTKITYDSKGLVTSGSAATTADITDSTNKRYVTDSQLTVLGNTSGTNTGDQTITLTGDVTGSGTGSFATTLATVTAAKGGTGQTTYTVGDILYASAATTLSKLSDVAAGSYLRSGGVSAAPVWSTLTLPNAATTGDLLQASASNTISSLTAVATGNALISGGVGAASSWGKIGLATHVTGTLPIANGGTNSTIALNNNRIIVSSGGALVEAAAATNGQLLIGSTGAAPVLATITDGYGHSTTNGAGTITNAVSLTTIHIDGTAPLTTTSATDVALSSSITGTPPAGTYLVMFSCSMGANNTTAALTTISLYTGASLGTATQVPGTERRVENGSGGQGSRITASVSFQVPVTFTGTSVYEIRWRRSAGTSSIFHRQLTLLRIE